MVLTSGCRRLTTARPMRSEKLKRADDESGRDI